MHTCSNHFPILSNLMPDFYFIFDNTGDTTAEVGEMSPDPNADIIARIRDEC